MSDIVIPIAYLGTLQIVCLTGLMRILFQFNGSYELVSAFTFSGSGTG